MKIHTDLKTDCEKWFGQPIEVITEIGKDYKSIQDVWTKHKSLNVATGAICSTQLKRRVREKYQGIKRIRLSDFWI